MKQATQFFKYSITIVWLALITIGFYILSSYSNTKGESRTDLQKDWPVKSQIERSLLPTLVMFVHPFCPCSMASINELSRLMPFIHDKVNVNVVFISLKNFDNNQDNDWKNTRLWKTANDIPGVKILKDKEEAEAKLFGAETSGHTVFYDQHGKLIFTGGLTPERGHEGDSIGRAAILSWFEKGENLKTVSSIFGCALRAPASN